VGRPLLDPQELCELVKQCGQTHAMPPFVRHALGRIIGPRKPGVNERRGRRRGGGRRAPLMANAAGAHLAPSPSKFTFNARHAAAPRHPL
jgi:hypothetical protein